MNPNFTDTGSDRRHGLPVEGVETLLDTPKLHTGKTPGVPRKRAHIAARDTEPLKRLVGHKSIYEYSYRQSSHNQQRRITTRCTCRRALSAGMSHRGHSPAAAERGRYADMSGHEGA